MTKMTKAQLIGRARAGLDDLDEVMGEIRRELATLDALPGQTCRANDTVAGRANSICKRIGDALDRLEHWRRAV